MTEVGGRALLTIFLTLSLMGCRAYTYVLYGSLDPDYDHCSVDYVCALFATFSASIRYDNFGTTTPFRESRTLYYPGRGPGLKNPDLGGA
jgi:hypothetical protein